MEITIRKALPEDAHDYAMCHISCWQSAYKGIVPDDFLQGMWASKEERVEKYRKAFAEPGDSEYFCVMYAERMIGFFFMSKSRDEDKSHAGEVVAIYLLEEFWDKSYGRKIMDYAVDRLKNQNYSEIILWTFEENARARRFYEKCNFKFDCAKKEMTWGKPLTLVRYVLLNVNDYE